MLEGFFMDKAALERLEAKGPTAVLEEMASGGYGQAGSPLRGEVDAWLRSKQAISEADSSAKRDTREKEILAIAKEANRLASEANSFARRRSRRELLTIIIAIIAIIIAAIAGRADIKWFISWVVKIFS
jgi:hypothetical protein